MRKNSLDRSEAMKKNRKDFFKNRVKNFYKETGRVYGRNRIKEYEVYPSQEDKGEEDAQNSQNPEEEGDFS
jgi:hypothetical protein